MRWILKNASSSFNAIRCLFFASMRCARDFYMNELVTDSKFPISSSSSALSVKINLLSWKESMTIARAWSTSNFAISWLRKTHWTSQKLRSTCSPSNPVSTSIRSTLYNSVCSCDSHEMITAVRFFANQLLFTMSRPFACSSSIDNRHFLWNSRNGDWMYSITATSHDSYASSNLSIASFNYLLGATEWRELPPIFLMLDIIS